MIWTTGGGENFGTFKVSIYAHRAQAMSAKLPGLSVALRGQLGFGRVFLYSVLGAVFWASGAKIFAYRLFGAAKPYAKDNRHFRRVFADLTRALFISCLKQSIGSEDGNYLKTKLAEIVQSDPKAAFRQWRASPPGRALASESEIWVRERISRSVASRSVLICSHRNWSFTDRVVDEFRDADWEVGTLSGRLIPPPFSMTASNLFLPSDRPIADANANWTALMSKLPVDASRIDKADVLFVDWANEPAIWMSRMAPPEKRLVVRLHSYEAFSPWVHFIPWGRVDALICVSEHLRAFMDDQLQLTKTYPHLEQYVVPNWSDPKLWADEKNEEARHRLIMVGYANSNKAPILAIRILEELIRISPDKEWKLDFVGHEWQSSGLDSEEERYRDQFFDYLKSETLRSAISLHKYTDKVGQHFQDAGFVLSASERESQHMAVVEGAMSGCVPVVRRWPLGERWNGAAQLYPDALLWETPHQAAELIHLHSNEDVWHEKRRAARLDARYRFSPQVLVPQLSDAVFGLRG
ncbi:hypothetical protein ACOXXX_19795 [Thalassococcus sp. BH17M4-6]|uniref:hypothetical protein n=1 Tax=Thalassococcus sp. BH17M4-6 TaxID=3413148 RepID=UPI003BE60541